MLLALLLLAIVPANKEGDAQAYTSLTDPQGRALADGRFAQHIAGGILHVEGRFDFPDGRTVVERASLQLEPQLEQQTWDWTERDKSGQVLRSYEVDLRTGKAVAFRLDKSKRWSDEVDVEPGKTFAGVGFMVVIKALRDQLAPGQSLGLKAIAFLPRPRAGSVTIVHDGPETLRMAGRSVPGDRFTIHPEVPAIARIFINVPDQHVWLFGEGPPAFLRFEGPMVEPGDPTVQINLINGPSARAQPRTPRPPRRH